MLSYVSPCIEVKTLRLRLYANIIPSALFSFFEDI